MVIDKCSGHAIDKGYLEIEASNLLELNYLMQIFLSIVKIFISLLYDAKVLK